MLKQNLQQKLQQKLSPQQIQFIQLLQLNTTELEKRVEEELTENPALENDQPENAAENDDNFNEDEYEEKSNDEEEYAEAAEYEVELDDYMDPDSDDYSYSLGFDPNEERKEVPLSTVNNLYDSLREQLAALRLPDTQKLLAIHLIGMLDEDGYLRRPLKSIAFDLAFLNNMQASEEELEYILKRIQEFEPAGIAARDLKECLLLQLYRKDREDAAYRLATKVIESHMTDLAKKHYEKLMRSLKVDRDQLREAVEIITRLNPKPGESQINTKAQYIIPDFIVTSVDGDLNVTLNARNAPELRVSKEYQNTLKSYKETGKKNTAIKSQVQFIKQKLDSAKWFIDAIKQRQNTLLQTMRTIVDYQKYFFITGDIERLQPMILKDIADRIGMDISTVSRVASSKYVQTDFGIFSLKEFFSEGIQTDSGEEVSNKEVKKVLKEMIAYEDKDAPLTDEKLTNMLNDKGYNIARRTVAKYREQMNIPVARLRKEL